MACGVALGAGVGGDGGGKEGVWPSRVITGSDPESGPRAMVVTSGADCSSTVTFSATRPNVEDPPASPVNSAV